MRKKATAHQERMLDFTKETLFFQFTNLKGQITEVSNFLETEKRNLALFAPIWLGPLLLEDNMAQGWTEWLSKGRFTLRVIVCQAITSHTETHRVILPGLIWLEVRNVWCSWLAVSLFEVVFWYESKGLSSTWLEVHATVCDDLRQKWIIMRRYWGSLLIYMQEIWFEIQKSMQYMMPEQNFSGCIKLIYVLMTKNADKPHKPRPTKTNHFKSSYTTLRLTAWFVSHASYSTT